MKKKEKKKTKKEEEKKEANVFTHFSFRLKGRATYFKMRERLIDKAKREKIGQKVGNLFFTGF